MSQPTQTEVTPVQRRQERLLVASFALQGILAGAPRLPGGLVPDVHREAATTEALTYADSLLGQLDAPDVQG